MAGYAVHELERRKTSGVARLLIPLDALQKVNEERSSSLASAAESLRAEPLTASLAGAILLQHRSANCAKS